MSNVARPHHIRDRADEAGTTPEALVLKTVQAEGGILPAARALNVAPQAIRYWLKKQNVHIESRRTVTIIADTEL